jgi:Protein of unknown function (DUF2281)
MEQEIIEKLRLLPEAGQVKVLRYVEALMAEPTGQLQRSTVVSRKNAFGIWQGEVWMADDFEAPLTDFRDYIGENKFQVLRSRIK